MTTGADPIVVLGSGLAGWPTVRELRKLEPGVPIVVASPALASAGLARGFVLAGKQTSRRAEMALRMAV